MRENTLVVVIVTSLIVVLGDESVKLTKGVRTNRDVQVPDSSLLLFDRMDRNKIAAVKYHARSRTKTKKKDSNSTDTTTLSPSTTSSSPSPSGPCTCALGVCKCCTGYVLDLFNQKACIQVTYNPGDFAFDVAMSLNDRYLYVNSVSGKNPKPMCLSPPRFSNMKVCAKLYNVFFPGRNFHFCLAMIGQWRKAELFNVSFDCLRMGANGFAMMKPDANGGLVVPNPHGGVDAVVDAGGDDIEDYDENLVKSLFGIFDDDKR